MKVLVCGDRNWDNYEKILNGVKKLVDKHKDVTIIQGSAKGADALGKQAAIECKIEQIEVKANWKKYGRAAGPMRNQEMLDLKPDLVLAFHSNIDSSKGTKDMVKRAEKAGVEVVVVT